MQRSRRGAVVLVAIILAAAACRAVASPLRAGAAKVDITPPAGLPLWGYFDRKTPAEGTLDPLYARVVALEAGKIRIAIVVLDLGRVFGPASLARIREAARRDSGVAYTLISATHTHSAPVILDEYPGGKTPAWENAAIEKIGRAIREACGRLDEARIGTGFGSVYIAHNRLRVKADGKAEFFERNTTRIPTAPVDPTVSVLRIDNVSGKPLAILVDYACHPVVFGADNLRYSADFPAAMVKIVEEAFDPAPMCMFLQGAPGDINPYYAVTPLREDAIRWREWTGVQLGKVAFETARQIRTEASADASIAYAEDVMSFRLRWDAAVLKTLLLKALGPDAFKTLVPAIRENIEAPVATLLINKRIALMAAPGEPFVDFQTNWRDRCPLPGAFFVGYANGYDGYFPTVEAATRGGYGAGSWTTWVEVGAGERMVNHALVRVYEMLGRLGNRPEE
jgi:neutral ceramidase